MQIEISEDGFLRILDAHMIAEELDRELIKCNQAIMELGGSATITMKVKLSRIPKMEKAIDIDIDVTSKHPEHERPSRTMFVNAHGGITDQFQEQGGLPLGAPVAPVNRGLSPASGNVTALKS